MLNDKWEPATHNKRQGLLSKNLPLHHDNRPHVAAATIQIIQNLKFEVLPRPPYSPDLAPCDLHAFCPHKMASFCGRCGSDKEMKTLAHARITENHT